MLSRLPGTRTKIVKLFAQIGLLALAAWLAYGNLWGFHLYRVTAYCDCPICVDIPAYRDGRFANGKRVFWGGAAADPAVPFGTHIELVPFWPGDWKAVWKFLDGRRQFIVTDRGGKIKGKDIDIFIPDSMGGHKQARKWGVRYVRIKINGKFAD